MRIFFLNPNNLELTVENAASRWPCQAGTPVHTHKQEQHPGAGRICAVPQRLETSAQRAQGSKIAMRTSSENSFLWVDLQSTFLVASITDRECLHYST